MKVIFLLADHAAVAEGKLYLNGAGWTETLADTHPMGLALLFEIPWTDTNRKIQFTVSLVDTDGNPVRQPAIGGDAPVEIAGDFEMGRPPGSAAGTTFNAPLAINIPPLHLAPGSRYEWLVKVDGLVEARAQFSTHASPS